MFRKVYQPILAVAIAHLLFVLSISPTWAETYSNSIVLKANDKFNEKKAKLILVEEEVEIEIDEHAVESYLEDNNLNEIELKIEMEEILVEPEDEGKGKGKNKKGSQYHLDFTLSPPGCYFDKPLKLKIKGKYKKVY